MTAETRSSELRNPLPAVDIIIELRDARIVLIDRRFPPHGMALPGGFIEVGETAEEAALREAREETGLEVELEALLGVYSDPDRDPRRHTLTMVFVGKATGEPEGGDDALHAFAVDIDDLDEYRLVFDHGRIVCDYLRWRREGTRPNPMLRAEPES